MIVAGDVVFVTGEKSTYVKGGSPWFQLCFMLSLSLSVVPGWL